MRIRLLGTRQLAAAALIAHCGRHRAGARWAYECARAHGRQAMTFETY